MANASHLSKYVAAFAITTLIFIVGIIVGNYISSQKLSTIDALQRDLTQKTISSELQYLLMSEHPCESVDASELTQELFDIGSKLDFMENQLGKTNADVISLKAYYSLLEIRHWLFLKKAKKECGVDADLIVYFYSNEGDCPECQQQGYVLSTIHRNYPSVNIYSFDINIDDPAVVTLRRIHGIYDAPTLVINDEVLQGSRTMHEVVARLHEHNESASSEDVNDNDSNVKEGMEMKWTISS